VTGKVLETLKGNFEDYFYAVKANTGRQVWRVKPALPN